MSPPGNGEKAAKCTVRLVTCILGACLLLVASRLSAQGLQEEATPFTAWLDFPRGAAEGWPSMGLPNWIESVAETSAVVQGQAVSTTFRIRLQELQRMDKQMELRLFFEDLPEAHPVVTGWSEIGSQIFKWEPHIQGLALPTSEGTSFGTANLDYIEVTVPGDGHTVRGAFLEVLKVQEIRRGLDFSAPPNLLEAFDRPAAVINPDDDMALFGRIRATLDRGVTKLTPEAPVGTWEFELNSLPLIMTVTFEVLGADMEAPLELVVNDRPVGGATVTWPDMADPAFVGIVRPLENAMRFRYAGWIRDHKVIPASALKTGINQLMFKLPSDAGVVAVRSLELQLKHNWRNLDYQLVPASP